MLEAQLLLMTVSTGILDATTFGTFHVFATKQTGNTLFLAMYALKYPAHGPGVERSVAVSIIAFVLGVAFFGYAARLMRQRQQRRTWLLVSNLLQTALLFAATAIWYWDPRAKTGWTVLAVIALLAFASGGQVVGAVSAGMHELNTTMITGTLVQLSNDPKLFHLHNVARDRRLLFYVSLLVGCFIGVAAVRYGGATLGLLLAAIVKAVASLSLILDEGVEAYETVDEEEGADLRGSGYAIPMSKSSRGH